jgi:polar amino acid transport system substrate-binding protein
MVCLLAATAFVVGCGSSGPGSTDGPPATGASQGAGPPASASPASAAPNAAQVQAFVNEAVDYARKHGKAAALRAFCAPDGQFRRGQLYVFAYDFDGNVIAHGGDPSLVGKDLLDMTDPNGLHVIRKLRALARAGGGWLYYMWGDPEADNQVEPKLGYVRKVDDTWFLGSGTYGSAATAPPSRAQVKAFVDKAWAYARTVGRAQAVRTFMDRSGPFFRGQLYVFGDTYRGVVVCFPAEPQSVGKDLWDRVDPNGVYPIREMARVAKTRGSGWVTYVYQDPSQGGLERVKMSYVRAVDGDWFIGAGTYRRQQ